MEVIQCNVCSSSNIKLFQEATYHLNLLPPLEIKRCLDCGFIFMSPRPDLSERNALFGGAVPDLLRPYSAEQANYGEVTKGRLEFFRKRIRDLLKELSYRPNEIHFLDIGASSGYMVEAALEAGIKAQGIEPGESGINAAKERGIGLIKSTAEVLPFPDNCFDIIHSHHVFEHIADPMVAAREAYRVLKPGGLLLIEVPNQFDNIRFWRDVLLNRVLQRKRDIRSVHHLSFFSKRSMKKLLSNAAFNEIKIRTYYTLTPKKLTRMIPGYITMLIGLFYLGGERVLAEARK